MDKTLEKDTSEELNIIDKYTLTFENNFSPLEELSFNEKNSFSQEEAQECTALVTVKEQRILSAQAMFKKSIRVSLKSFLISLSLSFLNLFI